MPIYDYKCSKCGHVFEVLQTKNINMEKCEKCGSKAKKLPAMRVGFVFKGSGFYVNDYGKKTDGTGKKNTGGKENAAALPAEKGAKTAEKKEPGKQSSSNTENSKPERSKTERKSEPRPGGGSKESAAVKRESKGDK